MPFVIYPSDALDFKLQESFLKGYHLHYRHLDWVSEAHRIQDPFAFTLVENGEIAAMLSCAPEVPEHAWIRYYVCERHADFQAHFQSLLNVAIPALRKAKVSHIYALGSPEWFGRLIAANQFTLTTQVITLHLDPAQHKAVNLLSSADDGDFQYQAISAHNLEAVHRIDQLAFQPMWQLGYENLRGCLKASTKTYLMTKDESAMAYLIAERLFGNQHISRLAVNPEYQGRRYGPALVSKMIAEGLAEGVDQFSVNTNADNLQSLAAYEGLGFTQARDSMPVYALSVNDSTFQL